MALIPQAVEDRIAALEEKVALIEEALAPIEITEEIEDGNSTE